MQDSAGGCGEFVMTGEQRSLSRCASESVENLSERRITQRQAGLPNGNVVPKVSKIPHELRFITA